MTSYIRLWKTVDCENVAPPPQDCSLVLWRKVFFSKIVLSFNILIPKKKDRQHSKNTDLKRPAEDDFERESEEAENVFRNRLYQECLVGDFHILWRFLSPRLPGADDRTLKKNRPTQPSTLDSSSVI